MIAIIAGCGANIASVQFALDRLGKSSVLTTDAKEIQKATHVILPGVGTADQAMLKLQQLGLIEVIRTLTQPVLGICLGMQLLYAHSAEGDVDCLGIVDQRVTPLSSVAGLTLPHMGWNQLHKMDIHHPLLKDIPNNAYLYFVHRFAAAVDAYTIAQTYYSQPFTAMVQKNNFYGAQFHPERSGKIGQTILENFVKLP